MTYHNVEWPRGGKQHVLIIYVRLHQDRIGQHWLWAAIERIVAGDCEKEVLRDFGYQKLGADGTAP